VNHGLHPQPDDELGPLVYRLWQDFLKRPADTRGLHWEQTYALLRDHFMKSPWNHVYDFVEFLPNTIRDKYGGNATSTNMRFVAACNRLLEREMSAWRFARFTLTQITAEQDLAAIDEARKLPRPMRVVNEHLDAALRLMSDRKNPTIEIPSKSPLVRWRACRLY
jgi:AbiJ N-terminal domain 4